MNDMPGTLRAILAELKAIRRILDRDSGADAISRGFPNGPPPATSQLSADERARRITVLNDARRRVTIETRRRPPQDEPPVPPVAA